MPAITLSSQLLSASGLDIGLLHQSQLTHLCLLHAVRVFEWIRATCKSPTDHSFSLSSTGATASPASRLLESSWSPPHAADSLSLHQHTTQSQFRECLWAGPLSVIGSSRCSKIICSSYASPFHLLMPSASHFPWTFSEIIGTFQFHFIYFILPLIFTTLLLTLCVFARLFIIKLGMFYHYHWEIHLVFI